MLFYNGLKEKFGLVGIVVKKSSSEFEEFEKEKFEELRKNYTLEALKDNQLIRCYRDFYWRIGIDPTKQRPSAEALLRRVLAGKDLPLINNVVDSYNLASILTLIPMGAYDAAKIKGELGIRYSKEESFAGIGGVSYKTSNEIVIADEEKLLCIYPYRAASQSCCARLKEFQKNISGTLQRQRSSLLRSSAAVKE